MIGVVYVNPEGVRVEEMVRLFEMMLVDIMKLKRHVFYVVMGDFNAIIGLGAEDHSNSNGKRLLDLERLGDFIAEKKLQCCVGRCMGK